MKILKTIYLAFITMLASTLSIMAFPIDWKNRIHSFFMRAWAKIFLHAGGVKVEVENLGNIEAANPAVIMINHESLIDIPVAVAGLPVEQRFLAKIELYKIPIFGWCLYLGGHIPVNRTNPKEAIRKINEKSGTIVERNQNFVIAPEGTRSVDGKIHRFKKGGFKIAEKFNLPIIPVTLLGNRYCAPKNSIFLKPGRVRVVVDEPVYLDDFDEITDCMDYVRERMARRKDNYEKLRLREENA
mgnify:CR=1 FL=1